MSDHPVMRLQAVRETLLETGAFDEAVKCIDEALASLQQSCSRYTGADPDATGLRVLATYIPRTAYGNSIMDAEPEHHRVFDVTDTIAAMDPDEALAITDDSREAANLWYRHPLSHVHISDYLWFRVNVQDQIRDYLQAKAA